MKNGQWRKPNVEGREGEEKKKKKKVVKAGEKRIKKNARKLFQEEQQDAIAEWIRQEGCDDARGSNTWFGYWKGAEKQVWDRLEDGEKKRYLEEAKRREEKPTLEEKRE